MKKREIQEYVFTIGGILIQTFLSETGVLF